MGQGLLLVGPSGSGKSTSLETLEPTQTFIINVKNKALPFKGWKSNYVPFSKENPNGNYIGTDDAATIIKIMQHVSDKMPHIKQLIVEDFQYMSANDYMRRSSETGFNKFVIIGKNIYDVADLHNKLRDDLTVVYINHDDESTDAMGDRKIKAKTIGKVVDNVIPAMAVSSAWKPAPSRNAMAATTCPIAAASVSSAAGIGTSVRVTTGAGFASAGAFAHSTTLPSEYVW